MAKVLIAGGTGLIGNRLSALLEKEGHEVMLLSRSKNKKSRYEVFQWDILQGIIEEQAILKADYVINLAGAGIADKPWSKSRKKMIIDSRVQSTNLLRQYFEKLNHQPKAYISSTAIGYYGDRGEDWVDEESEAGEGFLSESTKAWEESIHSIAATGIRTVGIRIGVVLSPDGGALEKMLLPLKMGMSTYFGSGDQWYSWIHIDDISDMFIHAIKNDQLQGFYNGVAPNPVRNKTLAKVLSQVSKGFSVLTPAPAFALRLAMGEMADVVLYSTRVKAEKIQSQGFTFKYPTIEEALSNLLQ
jgi:uncharacterized protein (TIGR01777 family)